MPGLTDGILKGRYRIEKPLGRGGMAEVYHAFDTRRHYAVAIKVLREDLAEDWDFVRRFQAEADSLARLAHQNIVRFYSFEQDGRTAFIVMDLIEGDTLRGRLFEAQGRPMAPAEALPIVRQVAAALAYAHSEGIIHRDVKPGNIMLRPDGTVLLSDFGIAKAADAATVTTATPGTPAYMSPEQCRGTQLDARTDVYSLGIVLYEMLAGRRPFMGQLAPDTVTGGTHERVRWEQMHADPPDPRSVNPALTDGVVQVMLQALAKTSDDRYPSALALAEALEAACTPPRPAPPEQPPDRLPPPPAPPAVEEPLPNRSRGILAAFAVVALAAGVIAVAFLLGRSWSRNGGQLGGAPTAAKPATAFAATVQISPSTAVTPTRPPIATPTLLPTATLTPTATPLPGPHLGIITDVVANLRVRSGPGVGYFVLGKLTAGDAVTITGRTADATWVQVEAGPDRQGWVSSEYVKANYPTEGAPIVSMPPSPQRLLVAQASADFASQQGFRDWFYLISTVPGSLKFARMPWDGGRWYRWCCDGNYNPEMRISDAGAFPSQRHDVARLWVSPYEGQLRVSGTALKESGAGRGGNGVLVRIVQNKDTIWEYSLGGYDTTGTSFDLTIASKSGDEFYFIVNAMGDDTADNTVLDPTIELLHPEGVDMPAPKRWAETAQGAAAKPTLVQTKPPAAALCFRPKLRHFEEHKGCCGEVVGLVKRTNGSPFGTGNLHIEGPPAPDHYVREFGVAKDGGYQVTALTALGSGIYYDVWLRGDGIRSDAYRVQFADPALIRAVVDFFQVPCDQLSNPRR